MSIFEILIDTLKGNLGFDNVIYGFTSLFFLIFLIPLSNKYYFDQPLVCWFPDEVKTEMESFTYMQKHCSLADVYHVQGEQQKFQFWHQIPVILIFQLLVFLAPKTLWDAFTWKNGLNVNELLGEFVERHLTTEKAQDIGRTIRQITTTRNTYFTRVYLCYKILNFINCALQLFWINQYLNSSYTVWGIGLLSDYFNKNDYQRSEKFPIELFCDVRDDISNPPINVTVQCTMSINLFAEKFYVIIWFWFGIITILNFFNLIHWLVFSTSDNCNTFFTEIQLSFSGAKYDEADLTDFVDWITLDGLTTIRLISGKAGDRKSSHIIAGLYRDFKEHLAKEEEEEAKKL